MSWPRCLWMARTAIQNTEVAIKIQTKVVAGRFMSKLVSIIPNNHCQNNFQNNFILLPGWTRGGFYGLLFAPMPPLNSELLAKAKGLGFSDRQIAHLTGSTEDKIRALRKKLNLVPSYRLVGTFATGVEAYSPTC